MDFSFSFIFAEQSNTIDGCGACMPVAIVVDLQPNIVLCESCPGLFSLAQLFFLADGETLVPLYSNTGSKSRKNTGKHLIRELQWSFRRCSD